MIEIVERIRGAASDLQISRNAGASYSEIKVNLEITLSLLAEALKEELPGKYRSCLRDIQSALQEAQRYFNANNLPMGYSRIRLAGRISIPSS